VEVVERTGVVGGVQVLWRAAGGVPERGASDAPVLYLHGVPSASWQWLPFLERTGGVAPDLPGFGRSAKSGGFDYSIGGYDRFLEAFVDSLGLERFSLVVHDWGAVGLALAQRMPHRVERLVLLPCVPLLPGYRWHRMARAWRTPLVGELVMGVATKRGLRRAFGASVPDWFIDRVWEEFDHGTQRAILRLYRSAREPLLAHAGERLGEVRCPALVLWSTRDPYIPARFGAAYADALGGEAALEEVDAGHWPWLDRPDVVGRVAGFVEPGLTGRRGGV
jgi:pimeloyl-ACP methyl ester carboxylesterase